MILVCSALLGGASVSAQQLSVRALALRAGEMPEVFVKGAKEFFPLEFSNVQPSQPVDVMNVNPLPLYSSGMDDEGEQAFASSQLIKFPGGSRGILLLGWISDEKPKYIAIKDDFKAARYNDWLLINAATKPVAFMVGENSKAMVVKPGESTTHRISVKKGVGATVLAQAPFDGEAKTFFSTFWPVYPDRRAVVLFVDDGKKIRVKRISDQLVPAKR